MAFNSSDTFEFEGLRLEEETDERLSQDLKKQKTVDEIKSILAGPNKDLLDEKFGQLKWEDLTVSFQEELYEKVPLRCRTLEFHKSFHFSFNPLIYVIKSDPNDDILLKFIEDYFNHQRKLNGHVTWYDFMNFFKQEDLRQWLRERCERPSLELYDIPLTPKTIVTLLEAEEDETKGGVTLVARIIELFIENESDDQINDICRSACKRLIASVVPWNLELFPCFLDMGEQLPLLGSEILTLEPCGTEKFTVHDSVTAYFAAMLMRRTFPLGYQKSVSEEEEIEHSKHWPNYFLKYFYGAPSGFALKLINLKDSTTRDLVTIYLLMSPDNIFMEFMAKQTSAYWKHLLGMVWPFKIKTYSIKLTLLHLAALKGDYQEVQFLLCNMGFSHVLDEPRFQDLIQVCVLETFYLSHGQIEERKKIIKTFLTCSKNMAATANSITCLPNVHIDLLKFLVERGPEVHEKIWSKKQMLLEAAEYLGTDQFHDLAKWLVEQGHSEMLTIRDGAGFSPLDLAIQRIFIKPETMLLFVGLGVLVSLEIRKKIMDLIWMGMMYRFKNNS